MLAAAPTRSIRATPRIEIELQHGELACSQFCFVDSSYCLSSPSSFKSLLPLGAEGTRWELACGTVGPGAFNQYRDGTGMLALESILTHWPSRQRSIRFLRTAEKRNAVTAKLSFALSLAGVDVVALNPVGRRGSPFMEER